jgi:hypothetical protein
MKKTLIIVSVMIVVFVLLAIFSHQKLAAQAQSTHPLGVPIGATQIFLTNAQVNPDENNQVIRAFIPTGSMSPNCLATLNDTNNFAFGTVLFCGNRHPSGSRPGVLVSIFFPAPVVPDMTMTVTLYQQGAIKYGAPVLCTATQGC